MEIASIILSSIALVLSLISIIWLTAKQLSSHQVQFVPLDQEMNKKTQLDTIFEQFKEIGERAAKPQPIGEDN
jgi:hypothetical protein